MAQKLVTGRLVAVVATALLGYSLFGYDTGVVSGGIVLIADEFDLTWYQKELVVTITNLLAAMAAAAGGPLGDRCGRRYLMMLAALFFIAGPVMSALAQGFVLLVVGRALLGVGVGLSFVAVPVYISEAAPEEIRGQLVDLSDLIVVFGQLVAGLVNGAAESLPSITWRVSVGGAALVAALQLAMLAFTPESPRWLLARGRREEAIEVLTQLKGGGSEKGSAVEAAVEGEVQAIEASLEAERVVDKSVWSRTRVKRALVIGVGLQVLNQLTGINTVMYYGATILESAGFSERNSIWLASLCNFAQFLGVCLQISIIDWRGRRFTALCSTAAVTVTLVLLGLSFAIGRDLAWLCVAALMSYLVSFGAGLSGVPYVVNSEIHPLEIRARCNAMAGVANWSLNLVVGSTFPVILHYIGAQYAFWSYAVVGAAGFAWMWRYLPETAHVPLESVDTFFEDPYPKAAWAKAGFNGLKAAQELSGLSSDEESSSSEETESAQVPE